MSGDQHLSDREETYYSRRAEDRAERAADAQQADADRAYMRALRRRRQREIEQQQKEKNDA